MKFLIKLHHGPLRLKIVLLLFVSPAFPFVIFVRNEFHDAREAMLQNTAILLTARGDEMNSKPDVFHELYQEGGKRLANLPGAESIDREELTGGAHV